MAFLFFTIGIFEENYDDVGGMEENTGSNTQGQNPEPICDENYDDLDTVKEQALQIQNGKVIFLKIIQLIWILMETFIPCSFV